VFFIGQQCEAGTSGLVSQVPAAAAGGGELGHGREELGSTACRGCQPVQRAFAAVSREIQYNVAIAIKSSTGRTPSRHQSPAAGAGVDMQAPKQRILQNRKRKETFSRLERPRPTLLRVCWPQVYPLDTVVQLNRFGCLHVVRVPAKAAVASS
jgi:hypothetical protein